MIKLNGVEIKLDKYPDGTFLFKNIPPIGGWCRDNIEWFFESMEELTAVEYITRYCWDHRVVPNLYMPYIPDARMDRGDDEAAKVYLKEQQELNDKIDFIKNTLKEWKENADVQKEKVEVLQQQLNDLKAEKESAVLTLETAQASKAFNVTPGVSSSEEEKMLEKVRDGVKKQKEAADGARIVYESSTIVQKQRLDKKMKDDEINKKLQELKAKKGK